ncbi:MAG TPA: HAD family hydrolase [Pyrinomonadaceae bacterium]|nr:HAD family hydrolase [Pyrinomonadaceae bacterium]
MSAQTGSIDTLLFDWDGTIVDSADLGLQAYEKSFATLGETFDRKVYEQAYSPNWYSTYEALGLPKEKWQIADDLWVKHYDELSAELVPGAMDAIATLRQKGYRLGVVSSGNDCRVNREIRSFGFEAAFEIVVCNEQMTNKKPHPEGLETALQALGANSASAAYIGDTPEDIEMGKRANLLTVAVRSSYPTSWKLQHAQADIYIESLAQLLEHF